MGKRDKKKTKRNRARKHFIMATTTNTITLTDLFMNIMRPPRESIPGHTTQQPRAISPSTHGS